MSYEYVVFWKNRKGSQFFQYFKILDNAIKFTKEFIPKPKIYRLVNEVQ